MNNCLESQKKTNHYGKRPYGVGLLVAGYDQDGPHLFETCPSGNYYEYYVRMFFNAGIFDWCKIAVG